MSLAAFAGSFAFMFPLFGKENAGQSLGAEKIS